MFQAMLKIVIKLAVEVRTNFRYPPDFEEANPKCSLDITSLVEGPFIFSISAQVSESTEMAQRDSNFLGPIVVIDNYAKEITAFPQHKQHQWLDAAHEQS